MLSQHVSLFDLTPAVWKDRWSDGQLVSVMSGEDKGSEGLLQSLYHTVSMHRSD